MKKLSVLLFAFLLFIPSCAQKDTPLDGAIRYLVKNTQSLAPASIGGDWTALVLAMNDPENELLADYRENTRSYIKEKDGVLHGSRYTEYSRLVYVLSLTESAVGLDPLDVDGYDIVSPLYDFEAVTKQGINGAAWALMALDALGATDSDEICGEYVSFILAAQNADGSFGQIAHSMADITAMCLRALAARRTDPAIMEACERGVVYLADAQGDSGGFPSPYGESSETIAQVILALDALGYSLTDPRFDAEVTLYDALLAYRNRDGGFCHNIGDDSDRLSTEQAALALAVFLD